MKMFYKITCGMIIAGLVLIGVGAATVVCEVNSFQDMGEKYGDNDERITETMEIELPDNLAKIYNYYFELEIDEGLEGNNAILDITHSVNSEVEVTPEIKDNCYLYNIFKDKFSEYAVNSINIGYSQRFMNAKSDFAFFKEFLADVKDKKIYNYDYYSDVEFKLWVSKEAYERFEDMPEGYELYSYSDYMYEMQERELEKEENYAEEYYDD